MNKTIYYIKSSVEKQSPAILTGLAVTGVPTIMYLTAKATPIAMEAIYQKSIFLNVPIEDMKLRDKIEAAWKAYIPAGITGLLTIFCVISSHSIHVKRTAALAGLYSIATETLKEYQAKVIETIGEKKEQAIRDSIAQDKIDKEPPDGVIFAGGEVLFYDAFSGRYFKSDMETIRRAVNDFNEELLTEMYKPANDFYDMIGLEEIESGRDMGWQVDNGLLAIDYSAKIVHAKGSKYEGEPCIVLTYRMEPRFL